MKKLIWVASLIILIGTMVPGCSEKTKEAKPVVDLNNVEKQTVENTDESEKISNVTTDVDNETLTVAGVNNVGKQSNTVIEEKSKGIDTSKDLANVSKLYSVADKIDCKNNFFEYKGLQINDYDHPNIKSRIITMDEMINITKEKQMININIKFYDTEKKYIGEYKARSNTTVDEDSHFALSPQESKNLSFTVYEADPNEVRTQFDAILIEGKSLSDVKYFSIEDIKNN